MFNSEKEVSQFQSMFFTEFIIHSLFFLFKLKCCSLSNWLLDCDGDNQLCVRGDDHQDHQVQDEKVQGGP